MPVFLLISYLCIFFLLNFYFDESITTLGKKNYYLIYTSLEYLSLAFLIFFVIPNSNFRKVITALSALFIAFLLVYYSIEDYKRIDSIPIGLESLLLIIYVIYFFYLSFKKANNENIYNNFPFWLVTGILLYVSFTFFFNILANNLDHQNFKKYFYYSYCGDILKNIFFTIAIFFISKSNQKIKSDKAVSVPYLDMI